MNLSELIFMMSPYEKANQTRPWRIASVSKNDWFWMMGCCISTVLTPVLERITATQCFSVVCLSAHYSNF